MDNLKVKQYYRDIEDYDWTYAADNLLGPETILHRFRERAMLKLLADYGKGPYLDAGCGTGLILRHLPANSTGLDLNPRNLEKAGKYAPAALLVQADLEEGWPFAAASFQTVTCTEVLEHLLYPEKALAEMARVLIPGGCLIGSVPSNSWLWRLRGLSSSKQHFQGEPYHQHRDRRAVAGLLQPFFPEVIIWARCWGMNWFFCCRNLA
jgi:SAM-dependent methyltransferase